jgi:hypothetical protein
MLFALIGLLFGLSFLLPSNSLTGYVVQDGTCQGMGCLELCEQDAPDGTPINPSVPACGEGLTCCRTHWASGVCEYPVNCETIREYSAYQAIETYQDSVREGPAPVMASTSFFLPILIIIGIIVYFMYLRKRPDQR